MLFPDCKRASGMEKIATGMKWLRPSQRATVMSTNSYLPVVAADDSKVWLVWGNSSTLHRAKQSVSGE
jgi:hypothetical protein